MEASGGPAEAREMRRLEPAAIAGVMSRELANFRTYWKGTTFSSVLEPIVYLLAFGLGLSATLVDEVDGVPYIEFVGTGMVATAVIFSSALPSMFGTFVKHRFQNTYEAILAAPVDVEELVTAEMLWIGVRSGVYGCTPLLVTIAFGLDPAPGMLLVPVFCFVTALGFAGFGVAMAATVAKIDQFNYVTALFVTPLFLVAGTFFPIDGLPGGDPDRRPAQPAAAACRTGPRRRLRLRGRGHRPLRLPAGLRDGDVADRLRPHVQAPDRLAPAALGNPIRFTMQYMANVMGFENGPCARLRSAISGRVHLIWLKPGSPAAPAASA